jgi:hypothetical protein
MSEHKTQAATSSRPRTDTANRLVPGFGVRRARKVEKNKKNASHCTVFAMAGELSIHNLPLTKYLWRNKGESNSLKTACFASKIDRNLPVLGNF